MDGADLAVSVIHDLVVTVVMYLPGEDVGPERLTVFHHSGSATFCSGVKLLIACVFCTSACVRGCVSAFAGMWIAYGRRLLYLMEQNDPCFKGCV